MTMKVGTELHGFTVRRVRELEEIQAVLWEMEHVKTGAQLCWLDRPDENKAFSIAFKTLPEDSTGVFHILEHSVLCGSDKYPVKEPFVELLKSSVQTFLNAMTYPDKTVYPVSSRNDQDFLNLMDIYLDSVLHPAIYHKPEIFRQEGWRFEPGEKISYQGVVLNEMKGAFGSPERVLANEMTRLLFPANCYQHESGGHPTNIPDLTYEQFLNSHRKYYHPSNARISLVGTVKLEAALEKIDSFLQVFEKQEIDFTIPMQEPIPALFCEKEYEIGENEPTAQRSIISYGTLLGTYADQKRSYAAAVLADYLAGDNEAPLKKAIVSAELGQDFSIGVHDGIQQSWISWTVRNTDGDKLEEIRKTIGAVLNRILEEGMDRQRLEACCNHFAFQMRDRDSSSLPRSLTEALELLEGWLYDGDPAQGLLVEEPLRQLSEALNTEYFTQLIRELFLDSAHGATITLVPSKTLGQEKADAEANAIEKRCAAWSQKDYETLQEEAKQLAVWQQTPDSAEALASIPMLKLSDLKETPEPLPMLVTKRGETTVLRHETGSKLCFLNLYFDASDLPLEELPLLAMLGRVLGKMGTTKHNSEELQMLIKQKIGSLSFYTSVYPGVDEKHCRVMLCASVECLQEQAEYATALVVEILTETVFRDGRLLHELLNQSAMWAQRSLSASGHQYALTRVSAYESAYGVAREYINGTQTVLWLKENSQAEDSQQEQLLCRMKQLTDKLVTEARMMISCSETVTERILGMLIFPKGDFQPQQADYQPLGIQKEGILIPAAVGFAVRGTNMKRHGLPFSGSCTVLANLLNFNYLWNEIRVQGGAYGCGFLCRDDGDAGFYTYRDPLPGRSLDVMDRAADFVRGFCAQKQQLTGLILSSVSALDPLLNTHTKMSVAESRYLKGTTYEDICRYYRQLLHTTEADLLDLCEILNQIAQGSACCVVAGQVQMEGCKERLEEIRRI